MSRPPARGASRLNEAKLSALLGTRTGLTSGTIRNLHQLYCRGRDGAADWVPSGSSRSKPFRPANVFDPFIDGGHHSVIGRIDVKADNVLEFLGKLRLI
jgi:hypothetical protein